ncbi:MarR family winged helix-turn-helix transcriptional regulator [Cellulomonas sp. PhB150]|uniref:MarR family winged helix-turn-helix transcriptional regulator n=1 Tax=Cellulomonas sp. PhB150 TaxID=2485188 RepID=UPI000F476985|nr:MarR family transcriptional regulator [Cellulomonas sp. PhB150]ROS30854.1 MarR family protein [Cellulomonas sp. PhB150]
MDPADDVAMPFLLMSAFRALVDAVHLDLAAAGFPDVRASHGFAMQAIGTGCTSVQLGERLGVSKQAAAKTARSLEEMGFVTRTASGADRRERILAPTERGETMLRLSARAFRHEVRAWRARAGDANVDATLTTLGVAPRGRRGPTDLSDWT